MIEMRVFKGRRQVRVSGHAGFGMKGKDIVCAAVSAIVEHTVRNLRRRAGLIFDGGDSGGVEFSWRRGDTGNEALCDAMIYSLESLSEQFPKNVKVVYE